MAYIRNNNSKRALETNNLMFYKNVSMEILDNRIKVIPSRTRHN